MIRSELLAWYDRHARALPWRRPPSGAHGRRPPIDPYRVWLSEVMLQQTTVAAVIPYFERFTAAFPTVADLAAASADEVMRLWAGLGYYSRARNLHAAARLLAADGFPSEEAGWRRLPGVGHYTAAAVAAIAYDQPANVVDGNVERVMARLFAVEQPLPDAKPALAALAAGLVADERPGDWAQALMDLGATVCTPRAPACGACPVAGACQARLSGAAEAFPRRKPKEARPQRFGTAFRLVDGEDVLLVRRPPKGLLGGMLALPSTGWSEGRASKTETESLAPAPARWRAVGTVAHVFTHFSLTLEVWEGASEGRRIEGIWTPRVDLGAAGLPTVFRKAALLFP